MIIANSPARPLYDTLLEIPAELRFGDFQFAKPLLLWINDGLMAMFFFLVGLGIKHEILVGELSDRARVVPSVIGAAGGIAIPALIFSIVNWGDSVAMTGWAIPSATDIAFANTGISLAGTGFDSLLQPITLGIAAGLFSGNQIGVFGFSYIAVKLGVARLPEGANWLQVYGISLLCGIGFTMSMFIASLAFEQGGAQIGSSDRIGILTCSFLCAICGYLVLRWISPDRNTEYEPAGNQ